MSRCPNACLNVECHCHGLQVTESPVSGAYHVPAFRWLCRDVDGALRGCQALEVFVYSTLPVDFDRGYDGGCACVCCLSLPSFCARLVSCGALLSIVVLPRRPTTFIFALRTKARDVKMRVCTSTWPVEFAFLSVNKFAIYSYLAYRKVTAEPRDDIARRARIRSLLS